MATKYEDGKPYMIRNLYSLKSSEVYEACYGMFEVLDGKIECTEKLFVTTEKRLKKWDVNGDEQTRLLRDKYDRAYSPYGLFEKIYRYESEIYI